MKRSIAKEKKGSTRGTGGDDSRRYQGVEQEEGIERGGCMRCRVEDSEVEKMEACWEANN